MMRVLVVIAYFTVTTVLLQSELPPPVIYR